ncbi:hypothetical protein NHQ30_000606 [Ciborinia camelliae]|nr:hypothetical protein NHQ30_000606 [Ciborinia camelliae]
MSPAVVLITGANRGLDKGLFQRYLELPNHIVIAGNRDPSHETSRNFAELLNGHESIINWLTIRINTEDDWLNAFVMAPGWVTTELVYEAAEGLGFEDTFIKENLISPDKSCDGMMKVHADTKKAKHGGRMVIYDGSIWEL